MLLIISTEGYCNYCNHNINNNSDINEYYYDEGDVM